MSNYSQTTFFGPKDNLPLGNPSKLILGTDVDTELANIATAIASKYDSASIAASPIGFQAGTAVNPAIYLGASTGTGLYQPASNQLGVSVSGTNVLTVSSTGLVCVGSETAASFVPTGSAVPANGLFLPSANTIGLAAGSTKVLQATSTALSTVGVNVSIGAPASGFALVINGASGSDILQLVGPAGQSAGLELKDGQTGNHVWVLHSGVPSAGYFDIYDTATSKAVLTIDTSDVVRVLDDGGTLQTVGYRGLPFNSQTSNYTVTVSDRGKSVRLRGSSSITITLPFPATGFSDGDTVVLLADFGNVANTITCSGGSLYWANGTVTSGSRTLTSVGVATCIYDSSTGWIISGSGLS